MNEAMKQDPEQEYIVERFSLPPASLTTQASDGGDYAIMVQCVVFTGLCKPRHGCWCWCCGVVVSHNNTTTPTPITMCVWFAVLLKLLWLVCFFFFRWAVCHDVMVERTSESIKVNKCLFLFLYVCRERIWGIGERRERWSFPMRAKNPISTWGTPAGIH